MPLSQVVYVNRGVCMCVYYFSSVREIISPALSKYHDFLLQLPL